MAGNLHWPESRDRGQLVIDEESTDENLGEYPEKRSIQSLLQLGVIPADKPAGPTSHEVVAWVRRILGLKKAGHSGTLDPLVTGLLPIGLGDATKALSILLLGPKEYQGVARLHSPVPESKLRSVLDQFQGEIYQRPPQRSSVKRTTRTRTIYSLRLMEQKGRLLLLSVVCEAGTYIRKLMYDIGEALAVGASLAELRRTRVCNLSEADGMVRLHNIVEAYDAWKREGREEGLRRFVRPVEHIASWMKGVVIRDSAVDAICHGAQLAVPGMLRLSRGIQTNEKVAVYTLKGELVSIAKALLSSDDILKAKKGLALATERVIMRPGVYTKMWGHSKA